MPSRHCLETVSKVAKRTKKKKFKTKFYNYIEKSKTYKPVVENDVARGRFLYYFLGRTTE